MLKDQDRSKKRSVEFSPDLPLEQSLDRPQGGSFERPLEGSFERPMEGSPKRRNKGEREKAGEANKTSGVAAALGRLMVQHGQDAEKEENEGEQLPEGEGQDEGELLKDKFSGTIFQKLRTRKEEKPLIERAERDPLLAQPQAEDAFRYLARRMRETSKTKNLTATQQKAAEDRKRLLETKRQEWTSMMNDSRQEDYFNKEVFSVLAGKNTELTWFMFENKIRDLITQVVDPLDNKTEKLSKKHLHMGRDFENLSKRLSEVEYTMERVKKQATDFDELKTNIERYKLELKDIVNQTRNEVTSILNRIAKNDARVTDVHNTVDMIRKEAQELKDDFKVAVTESQGLVGQAVTMQIEVKQECTGLIDKAQTKIKGIEKLRIDFNRFSDSIKGDISLINVNMEKARKKTHLQFVDTEKKMRQTEYAHGMKLNQAILDLEAQARQLTQFQTEHRNLEFYVDKILPIKGHSQICSALHNVLRQKDEYNNLIQYEHKYLELLKQKTTIQKPTKRDLEKMKVVLPTVPVIASSKEFVDDLQFRPEQQEQTQDILVEDTDGPKEDIEAGKFITQLQQLIDEEDQDVEKLKPYITLEEPVQTGKKKDKKKGKNKDKGGESPSRRKEKEQGRSPEKEKSNKKKRKETIDPEFVVKFLSTFKEKQVQDSKVLFKQNVLLERQNCLNFAYMVEQGILQSKGKLIYEAIIDAVKVSTTNIQANSAFFQTTDIETKIKEQKQKETYNRMVNNLQQCLQLLQEKATMQAEQIQKQQEETAELKTQVEENQTQVEENITNLQAAVKKKNKRERKAEMEEEEAQNRPQPVQPTPVTVTDVQDINIDQQLANQSGVQSSVVSSYNGQVDDKMVAATNGQIQVISDDKLNALEQKQTSLEQKVVELQTQLQESVEKLKAATEQFTMPMPMSFEPLSADNGQYPIGGQGEPAEFQNLYSNVQMFGNIEMDSKVSGDLATTPDKNVILPVMAADQEMEPNNIEIEQEQNSPSIKNLNEDEVEHTSATFQNDNFTSTKDYRELIDESPVKIEPDQMEPDQMKPIQMEVKINSESVVQEITVENTELTNVAIVVPPNVEQQETNVQEPTTDQPPNEDQQVKKEEDPNANQEQTEQPHQEGEILDNVDKKEQNAAATKIVQPEVMQIQILQEQPIKKEEVKTIVVNQSANTPNPTAITSKSPIEPFKLKPITLIPKPIKGYENESFGIPPKSVTPDINQMPHGANITSIINRDGGAMGFKTEVSPVVPTKNQQVSSNTFLSTTKVTDFHQHPDHKQGDTRKQQVINLTSHIQRHIREQVANAKKNVSSNAAISSHRSGRGKTSDDGSESETHSNHITLEILEYALSNMKVEVLQEIDARATRIAQAMALQSSKPLFDNIRRIEQMALPRLETMIKQTKEAIGNQHMDFFKNVEKLQGTQNQAFEVMNNTHKKFLREKSDLQTQFKGIYDRLDQILLQQADIQRQEESLLKVIEFVQQGDQIKYYLDHQDELDRRNIGLFGLQSQQKREESAKKTGRITLRGSLDKNQSEADEKGEISKFENSIMSNTDTELGMDSTQPNQYIKIDRSCIGCKCQLPFVQKAFKLACLSYEPSKVLFQGEVHTRLGLVDKRFQILEIQRKLLVEIRNRHFQMNASFDQQTNISQDLGDLVSSVDLTMHPRMDVPSKDQGDASTSIHKSRVVRPPNIDHLHSSRYGSEMNDANESQGKRLAIPILNTGLPAQNSYLQEDADFIEVIGQKPAVTTTRINSVPPRDTMSKTTIGKQKLAKTSIKEDDSYWVGKIDLYNQSNYALLPLEKRRNGSIDPNNEIVNVSEVRILKPTTEEILAKHAALNPDFNDDINIESKYHQHSVSAVASRNISIEEQSTVHMPSLKRRERIAELENIVNSKTRMLNMQKVSTHRHSYLSNLNNKGRQTKMSRASVDLPTASQDHELPNISQSSLSQSIQQLKQVKNRLKTKAAGATVSSGFVSLPNSGQKMAKWRRSSLGD